MVAQGKAEQEVINSTVDKLGKNVAKTGVGGPVQPLANGRAAPMVFSEKHEVPALRRQVATLDAALLDRDVEIEQLKIKANKMETALQHIRSDSLNAGLWEERYEDAKRVADAHSKRINDAHKEKEERVQQIRCLVQYVRTQERSSVICKAQIGRLGGETHSRQDQLLLSDMRRKKLSDQVTELEDGFVRCVGRITNSLTAGIITLSISEHDTGAVRFAVFRKIGKDSGIMEIFEEPDSYNEKISISITPETDVRITAHQQVLIRSSRDSEVAAMGCASEEELEKWLGAFYLIGRIPPEAISSHPWPK